MSRAIVGVETFNYVLFEVCIDIKTTALSVINGGFSWPQKCSVDS